MSERDTCPRCGRGWCCHVGDGHDEPICPTPDDPNDMCREHLLAAYHALARQVTISQHAADVTSIAHEWAKAYRAHHTRTKLPPVTVKSFSCSYDPPEEPMEWNGPHPETTKSANRLSAAARRLERACLGPREKKGPL